MVRIPVYSCRFHYLMKGLLHTNFSIKTLPNFSLPPKPLGPVSSKTLPYAMPFPIMRAGGVHNWHTPVRVCMKQALTLRGRRSGGNRCGASRTRPCAQRRRRAQRCRPPPPLPPPPSPPSPRWLSAGKKKKTEHRHHPCVVGEQFPRVHY